LKEDGSQVLKGMSQDQVNKYAAFQFLDEVKKRKSSSSLSMQHSDETDIMESDDSAEMTKVVFKRPSKSISRTGKQSRTQTHSLRSEDGDLKTKDQEEGDSASDGGGGGIKMAEYVVGSKAAAQLHRERRRQRKAKMVSLHSEEKLEEEGAGEREDGADMDNIAELGDGSENTKRAVKKRMVSSTAISLSHLEEEEDT
jgi:hypothetical protein